MNKNKIKHGKNAGVYKKPFQVFFAHSEIILAFSFLKNFLFYNYNMAKLKKSHYFFK